ncbi:MAG: HNH endonuclease, partial [Actinomycetota bacterium]|nr:HNH endonuclease [Actinomycetota bacterium]
RYPGCDRPANRCDLDHTAAYPAGPTTTENLGALCRRHHLLKHHQPDPTTGRAGPPRLRQPAPGHFIWTLPTGHRHSTRPPPLHEPDDPLARPPSRIHPPPTVDIRRPVDIRRSVVCLDDYRHASQRAG